MSLAVVGPGVFAVREVSLHVACECHFVTVGIELAQSSLRDRRGACRTEKMARGGAWGACTAEGLPNVAFSLPIWRVFAA